MWNFLCLSHFVINIFKKPKKSIRGLLAKLCNKNCYCKEFREDPFFLFPKQLGEQWNTPNCYLFWKFRIFNNSLGKILTSKFFLHDLWYSSRQRYTLCSVPIFFSIGKVEWKTAVFRESIDTEFHIWEFFSPFWPNLLQKNKIVCLRSN